VVDIGVQVNGKLRGVIQIAVDAEEAAARELATSEAKIASHLEGKAIKKVIYVRGKILNFIVG
jgi:leucyl-tRNA synthetase